MVIWRPTNNVRLYARYGRVYSSKSRTAPFCEIRLSSIDPGYSQGEGTCIETRIPGSPFQVKIEFEKGAWESLVRAEYQRLAEAADESTEAV